MEFRFEVFNLFNWANFEIPVNDLGNPDFGSITNTIGGPRVGQFAFRFLF
jgi:hypothetical protein